MHGTRYFTISQQEHIPQRLALYLSSYLQAQAARYPLVIIKNLSSAPIQLSLSVVQFVAEHRTSLLYMQWASTSLCNDSAHHVCCYPAQLHFTSGGWRKADSQVTLTLWEISWCKTYIHIRATKIDPWCKPNFPQSNILSWITLPTSTPMSSRWFAP